MANSYSEDLRERVLKYVEVCSDLNEAIKIFNVSKSSIVRWRKRYLELGHCQPKKNLGKKPRIDIVDFEKYVRENPDKTLKQIGEHFEMTDVGALYYMNKINFRYKKKSLVTERRHKNRYKNI
jgi:transposase